MRTWRNRAAPIVAQVLAAHKGEPEQQIRRALREAYPFGMRAYHPYKIWLDEIHRQRHTNRYVRLPGTDTEGLPLFDSARKEG